MVCILIREIYKYYKCSDPAFLQALISITQQINPKVEFQANKDLLLIVIRACRKAGSEYL